MPTQARYSGTLGAPLDRFPTQSAHEFLFIGKIRYETARALMLCPRDYCLLNGACFWAPREIYRTVLHIDDQFRVLAIPEWFARAKGFFDPGARER
jgi:hypothetical protein